MVGDSQSVSHQRDAPRGKDEAFGVEGSFRSQPAGKDAIALRDANKR
jgi:hypothetical protein